MYATIHRFRRWPDEESAEWGRSLLEALSGGGNAGACVLGRLDGLDGAVVAFWGDRSAAEAAASRTGEGVRWLGASVYAVAETQVGSAAGERPRFAQIVWLNGAGDPDRADAAIRAGRERIAPAVRDVEGVISTHVLRAEDHRMVVVTLVTGVDVPEALSRTILSTDLLPWEDPAQLTDPDRIDIDRVIVADLPALAGTEVRS